MDYKVYFDADILFPKGRVARKTGDCNLSCELSMEEMKADEDLRRFIGFQVNKEYKTGSVINVIIKDIQISKQ